MTSQLPYLDADVVAALSAPAAVRALRAALVGGLDPAADPARWAVPTRAGELLMMPADGPVHAGIKIVSIAADNPSRGLPRIQGIYLLLDARTLTPQALLDGVALTNIRTAAVSALAASLLAPPDARRLVVFGTGPQAHSHTAALASIFPLERVTVVGRTPANVAAFVARWTGLVPQVAAGSVDDVGDADLVVCVTTAREPLFAQDAVADHAVLVAVGSHQPGILELPPDLLARAAVVVEDPATALREAGEVVAAVERGLIRTTDLVPLADLVADRVAVPADRPRVFKSVGMAWEDRVVAEAVFAAQVESVGADG